MALFGIIVPVQNYECAEGCFPPARFYDVFGGGVTYIEKQDPETPTKGGAMKVNIEMDMTPEEARAFMGLPDVAPLQKKMLEDMQARMKAAFDANDLDGMMRAWMPLSYGMGAGPRPFRSSRRRCGTARPPC